MADVSVVNVIYNIQLLLLYTCMIMCLSVVPILSIAYYRNRRHPVLKTRRAEWSLINQALIVIVAETLGYNGLPPYPPCAQILFPHVVFCTVSLLIHIIRCWLLLYNWNVSKALCEVQFDLTESHKNWWLHHSYLASNRLMVVITTMTTLICIGWWFSLCGLNGWDRSFNDPVEYPICTSWVLWQFGDQGLLTLLMVIAVYETYQIRLVADVFEIKEELMAVGGSWLYMVLPWWAIALWFPVVMEYPNYSIMMALSVDLCCLRVLYLVVAKPLMMVYAETHNRSNSFEDAIEAGSTTTEDAGTIATTMRRISTRLLRPKTKDATLRKMLDTNTGIAKEFVQFLIKEFSVENWRFYSDVLQLRILYGGWKQSYAGLSGLQSGHLEWFRAQGAAVGSLEDNINRIYSMYLKESAPFEVNLSSQNLKDIRRCFGPDMRLKPTCINDIPALMCRAQDEIFELMKADSYSRFKNSPEFDHSKLALV